MYLEGSDQHRGWFHSSLLASCAMHGQAPYRQVLTHGFTVDAKGMKMSKSVGNVVAPIKVTKTLGADILRLWVAATDYSGEMSISDEILKRTADSYRRIRNTLRFLLANTNGFDPAEHSVAAADLLALDQWIVAETHRLQTELQQHYDDYHFHVAVQKIHNFCSETLGGFYLDVIKDRQYTTQADSLARRSCQTAMYHVTEAMTRWNRRRGMGKHAGRARRPRRVHRGMVRRLVRLLEQRRRRRRLGRARAGTRPGQAPPRGAAPGRQDRLQPGRRRHHICRSGANRSAAVD
jgi:isoleucyl-tRNA synthetase